MSLVIIGEAAAKVMEGHAAFTRAHSEVPWRGMRNAWPTVTSTSTSTWCGRRSGSGRRSC
ncbi:ribonuclease HepT family protein [Variovorax sp. PvP013]|uniref:hypothetical protein n=1 Tax=Variovorax sp. PvP013 TaxID=3156435 RepID=UPI003D1EAA9E